MQVLVEPQQSYLSTWLCMAIRQCEWTCCVLSPRLIDKSLTISVIVVLLYVPNTQRPNLSTLWIVTRPKALMLVAYCHRGWLLHLHQWVSLLYCYMSQIHSVQTSAHFELWLDQKIWCLSRIVTEVDCYVFINKCHCCIALRPKYTAFISYAWL